MIIKAYLGWSNPETAGGENLRLYSLERGPSPRWAFDGGWTVEREIITQSGPDQEGDRYLVVKLGNRFFPEGYADALVEEIEARIAALNEMFNAGIDAGKKIQQAN